MCPLKSHGREKAFPQVGQTQGSVCERMCIFRAPRLLYSLGQCLQKNAGRVAGTGGSLLSSLCPALPLLLRLGLLVCWGWYVSEESGLGGSDVRPSSSSPLLLQLTLEGELRSSGPWLVERVVGDDGSCREGSKLTSQTNPVVRQVTGMSLVTVGSSASGYLSGKVSGNKNAMRLKPYHYD